MHQLDGANAAPQVDRRGSTGRSPSRCTLDAMGRAEYWPWSWTLSRLIVAAYDDGHGWLSGLNPHPGRSCIARLEPLISRHDVLAGADRLRTCGPSTGVRRKYEAPALWRMGVWPFEFSVWWRSVVASNSRHDYSSSYVVSWSPSFRSAYFHPSYVPQSLWLT